MALLSVIIPTHNRQHLITDALDSVFAQAYRPVEVIVIDDGSTDETREVIAEWEKSKINDPRFKLIYQYQENAGPSAARNMGLQLASGSFVHFLDSDDTTLNSLYQTVIPRMQQSGVDMAHFGINFQVVGASFVGGTYLPVESTEILDDFFEGQLKGFGCAFIRTKDLVDRVGKWDERMRISEDKDYCLRTILEAKSVIKIGEPLYNARSHDGDNLNQNRVNRQRWVTRLHGEENIIDYIIAYKIDVRNVQLFRANLFNLGIHMYHLGYDDLGDAFGELALSIKTSVKTLAEKRMFGIWRMGPRFCSMWVKGRWCKLRLKRHLLGIVGRS